MNLTLAVAAPTGSDAALFYEALEADGVLASSLVSVLVAQDASRPFGDSRPGIEVKTAPAGASIFALWGMAVSASSSPYVALLDARCPLDRGWLSAMLARLADGSAAFFGPVICGWPTSSANVVGYLTEYVQFDRPLPPGLKETPGINLVVRHGLAVDPAVLEDGEFIKTRLLARLADLGEAPLPVEPASVTYRKAYEFASYCQHRFDHGRCYGASRSFRDVWSRMFAIVATPALPLLRTWRIVRAARAPEMGRACRRWLHRILIAEIFWSLGEALGYLAGEGSSRRGLT